MARSARISLLTAALLGAIALPSQAEILPLAQAKDLVTRAQRVFMSLPGYETDLHFFQRRGDRTAHGLYAVTGKPPRQLRIVIHEGEGKGTRLFWDGGKTVRVRPAGLLGALVIPLGLDDERLLSIRGYAINQTEIGNFLRLLASNETQIQRVQRDGKEITVSAVGSDLLPGCTAMTMALDEATLYPRAVELFDGKELVFQLKLDNLRVTSDVSFDL